MIHKIYILQWIVLSLGAIFLFLSIFAFLKGSRRDKIISVSVLGACLFVLVMSKIIVKSHNAKANVYLGVHELKDYGGSNDFKLEILPNNQYLIYNSQDTAVNGSWELSVSKDSEILLLDGRIFGLGELELK